MLSSFSQVREFSLLGEGFKVRRFVCLKSALRNIRLNGGGQSERKWRRLADIAFFGVLEPEGK